jgi:hypothetical protein
VGARDWILTNGFTGSFGLDGAKSNGVSLAAIPTPFLADRRPDTGFRSVLQGRCNSASLLTSLVVGGGGGGMTSFVATSIPLYSMEDRVSLLLTSAVQV